MKKKIVSTLVVIGLLIVLGGYSYNVQYRQKPEIKHFTAFFSVTGRPLGTQNDIKEIIADEIGADCEENWLVGQSKEEVLNSYIASGEYPDFILGEKALLEADALIPIDEYWDDYPNLRNYLSDEQWEHFRQEDGHIYWIPPFCVSQGENIEVTHTGEAFWIQTRVLKWAGYPKITTVDEYFDLIEAYVQANPVMPGGTKMFRLPCCAMTGDSSVWRMCRSFWMDIPMTEVVWLIPGMIRSLIIIRRRLPDGIFRS